ncbi:hypothetical protein BV898_04352 [Hypsibius exemplaris]|uniref:Uncharacterized protein n=1 Tax=Hypsibius exemplaris TaxID=2072580 RepID=A0A1W0X2Q0_HYPEX|nr:hypothetical protein BV898_04352 [Hypsibius exemplaris]
MADSSKSELSVSRMDRKKAQKVSEEIGDLLKEAFEKHRTVAKGFQRLEDEILFLKVKAEEDKFKLEKLQRENTSLEDDLSDANKRIANLAKQVGRLQTEVAHWNRKACEVKPMADRNVTALPLQNVSATTSLAVTMPSVVVQRRQITSESATDISPEVFTEKDSTDTGDGASAVDHRPKARRQLFSLIIDKSSNPGTSNGIERKRSCDEIPETPSPPPEPRLQTNTCKVCERYWRAEDARRPGQLKTYDIPYCKVHGKNERPANTPPNFWKQARLSSPKVPK